MREYVTSYEECETADHIKYTLPIEKCEEIVRCRDCKHYMDYEHEYEPNLGYCREHDREEVRDSGFCVWAERKALR